MVEVADASDATEGDIGIAGFCTTYQTDSCANTHKHTNKQQRTRAGTRMAAGADRQRVRRRRGRLTHGTVSSPTRLSVSVTAAASDKSTGRPSSAAREDERDRRTPRTAVAVADNNAAPSSDETAARLSALGLSNGDVIRTGRGGSAGGGCGDAGPGDTESGACVGRSGRASSNSIRERLRDSMRRHRSASHCAVHGTEEGDNGGPCAAVLRLARLWTATVRERRQTEQQSAYIRQ